MAPASTQKADDSVTVDLKSYSNILDKTSFEQILEMDDDDDRDFSKGIVYGFFEQAETTFEKIEKGIEDKNLESLSELGHFLKGSSATLGMTSVQDYCEKIQHLGSRKERSGEPSVSPKKDEDYLDEIKLILEKLEQGYREVERVLRRFYGETVEDPVVTPEAKETDETDEEPMAKEKKESATTEEDSAKQVPETAKDSEDTKGSEIKEDAK